MKMNKTLWAMIAAVMLLVTVGGALAAPAMPHPVYGKVTILDEVKPYHDVTLKTCDYRQSTPTSCKVLTETHFETDATGNYVFELANINPLWRPGDLVLIDVCDGHPNCEIIVSLGDSSTNLDFAIGEAAPISSSTGKPETITETMEKENIVYVPNDKSEELKVLIAGIETTLEDLKKGEKLSWWHGMWAIIAFLAALGGYKWGQGRKTAATIVKKNKEGSYI